MVINDALKTVGKVFLNNVGAGIGFISNGTRYVNTFNFDEVTIIRRVDLNVLSWEVVSPAALEIYHDLIKMIFDKDVYIEI